MSKRYGTPYMGSKNFIAKELVNIIPPAGHFYDLFAGGCAVTHAAMESGKWEKYIVNDLCDAPRLFADAVNGKYKDEKRWISREDFERLKDSEPYVKYCWSFGNKGQSYMYGRDIEELRRLQWGACFADTPYERKLYMRRMFRYIYFNLGLLLCYPDIAKGEEVSGKMIETCKKIASGQEPLQYLQSLQRLQSLESLQSLQRLEVHKGDYRDVHIESDSVIYCDIPYKGKTGYTKKAGDGFDYSSFYDWCCMQSVPVFISEYNIDDSRFISLYEREKAVTLCATDNRQHATERLYIPRAQMSLYEAMKKDKERLGTLFEGVA